MTFFPDGFTKFFASSFSFPKRFACSKSLKEVVSYSFNIFYLYSLKRENEEHHPDPFLVLSFTEHDPLMNPSIT